jgi:hypothetical protein
VEKSFKTYLGAFDVVLKSSADGTGTARPPRMKKDLWLFELDYFSQAGDFAESCASYRKEMSGMYLDIQKLELERLETLKNVLARYLRLVRATWASSSNSQESTSAAACIDQLDGQKDVVLQLNKLNEKSAEGKKRGKESDGQAEGDSPESREGATAAEGGATELKHPPKPGESNLLQHSGLLYMKSGILRSYKPYRAVLTNSNFVHVFEAHALSKPSGFEVIFTINVQNVVSVKPAPGTHELTFEVTETVGGFLGLGTQKVHAFKGENKVEMDRWISALSSVN